MTFLSGLVVGLIVGWNFLPQPQWVKTLVDKAVVKISDKFSK